MAEEQKQEEAVEPKADEQVEEANAEEAKPKPGRKPQVRRTSKSKDDAGEEESEDEEDGTDEVRVIKAGEDYTVKTEDKGGQTVAAETVVEEFTIEGSSRTYNRLVARKGTIVK